MDSNNRSPSLQGVRDHVLRKNWDKFDSVVMNLVGLGASPIDLEARLQSVLGGHTEQGEQGDRDETGNAAVKLNSSSTVEARHASKEFHNTRIKVEDDDEQPRIIANHNSNRNGMSQPLDMGERKRKAGESIGAVNCNSKRPKSMTRNQSAGKKTNSAESGDDEDSFDAAPVDADRKLTPAAHLYRNETGVAVRDTVGWQFRKVRGTTKVWYANKWQVLIQDQPDFIGVREGKGGWIMPVMARPKQASVKMRTRWDLQAKVEFNSPF